MAEKVDPKSLKLPKDIVAQDRNWTLRVNNQLEAEQKWNNQWGYYAKGISDGIQDSLLKSQKYNKKKQLMIGFINFSKKSIKQKVRFSKRLLLLMEKDKRSRFTRMINTIFTKIKILEHYKGVFPRVGKSRNGLLVIFILFSC